MRVFSILMVLVTISSHAAAETVATVRAVRGGLIELDAETQARVAAWAMKFLSSANFNTANHPDVLKQTVTHIHQRYRDTAAGDHLVVTFSDPSTVETVGGRIVCREIIVGLARPDQFPSALFTVDDEGRVVAHEKYAAILPEELHPR